MNTHKQQGAVLLVSLIMLVIITVIGLASMRDTTLQERMAANLRDQQISLQAAEAALRAGERQLISLFHTNAGLLQIEASKDHEIENISTPQVNQPRYSLRFLGHARINNPVAGEPIDEGYLVRVKGEGAGTMLKTDNTTPSTTTTINTLVLVVPDQLQDD